MMRTLPLALCLAALALASTAANADPLKNTSVTGSLTVTGGPGFASTDFGTTTITNSEEFSAVSDTQTESGMGKTWNTENTYSADFLWETVMRPYNQLVINNLCTALTSTGNGPCNHDPYYAFTMVFTDSAFIGLDATIENNQPGGLYSLTLVGNTLTITSTGGIAPTPGQSLVINFSEAPVLTPEPSSILLTATGMLALAAIARRRFAL